MPLKTVDVAKREGRVCYVTEEGKDTYVTIECPIERVAYRIRWDGWRTQPGDWVAFRGKAKREIVSKKGEEERLRVIPYYHTPYDGSAQAEWSYLDIVDAEGLERIGPLDKLDALRAARDALSDHIRDWYGQQDRLKVGADVDALSTATDVVRERLSEIMRESGEATAKTVAVDIEV